MKTSLRVLVIITVLMLLGEGAYAQGKELWEYDPVTKGMKKVKSSSTVVTDGEKSMTINVNCCGTQPQPVVGNVQRTWPQKQRCNKPAEKHHCDHSGCVSKKDFEAFKDQIVCRMDNFQTQLDGFRKELSDLNIRVQDVELDVTALKQAKTPQDVNRVTYEIMEKYWQTHMPDMSMTITQEQYAHLIKMLRRNNRINIICAVVNGVATFFNVAAATGLLTKAFSCKVPASAPQNAAWQSSGKGGVYQGSASQQITPRNPVVPNVGGHKGAGDFINPANTNLNIGGHGGGGFLNPVTPHGGG
jgi:hypothetical protein